MRCLYMLILDKIALVSEIVLAIVVPTMTATWALCYNPHLSPYFTEELM
jgi:hypothetical protein